VSLLGGGLGFGMAGNDSLADGRIKAEDFVEIRLQDVAVNAMYQANFRRFGVAASDCVALGSVPHKTQTATRTWN
jgi:hypothetical protein